MADAVYSDVFSGSKRTMEKNIFHQEQEPSNSISSQASVKESSPKENDQEIMQDVPSPISSNKVSCLFPESYGNVEENKVISGSVCDFASGSFEGGAQLGVESIGLQGSTDMGSTEENICLEDTERKECMMSFLEDKKKQLLERIETGSIFLAGVEGNDESIRQIDNTALIESVSFAKTSNAENMKEKQEVGNKAKQPRRKKDGRNVLETREKQKKTTQFGKDTNKLNHLLESQIGSPKNSSLLRYSMEEMLALRFVGIVEQQKLWKDIYTRFGDSVTKEYDALSWDQKNIHLSFDPRRQHGRKEDVRTSQREVSAENGKVELGNMGEDGVEIVCGLGPASNASIEGEDVSTTFEAEYDEEVDSEEDYASIQKPVFHVEGEPDFDSGPPEDGWEYLRRVRWEAAHIPKVVVAKLDRSQGDKEQSIYMPQIPEIAECPEHLMPLKQWEDAFLSDFSELRMFLSCDEDSSTEISCSNKQPIMATGHWQSTFPQLDESIIIQKFNDLRTDDVDNSIGQPCSSNAQDTTPTNYDGDFKCEYPTLSAVLAMDSVTRVSMLKKRIALAETMNTLSKNDCIWLFALCAAVDTPLHADTCAALRSLLRKCASLRAAKSELDDEVIMLNILATISGKYFGQSEK